MLAGVDGEHRTARPGLWLGLSQSNLESLNTRARLRQQDPVHVRASAHGSVHGSSEDGQQAGRVQGRRKPQWIEKLQRNDKQALISRIGVEQATVLGLVKDVDPNRTTAAASLLLLQQRIQEREVAAQVAVNEWQRLGHTWPPVPAKVPEAWGDTTGLVLQPDLGVIVLYVHKRVHYLKTTLAALSRVEGISGMLLVVR